MSSPFRILFVCMGNICRSPAAHIVMKQLVQSENLDDYIQIESAGTIGYHQGNAPDARMSKTLEKRGYLIFGQAQQIKKSDLADFDLILTMDNDNLGNVRELDPQKDYIDKIQRFTDFCDRFDDDEVPDPYYGGQAGFEHVADLVENGCEVLLEDIKAKLKI